LGDWFSGIFGKKEETPPMNVQAVTGTASNVQTNSSPVNAVANAANANAAANAAATSAAQKRNGNNSTVLKKGGMAPIHMKDSMFYPTQRQLEWATTAGLPCTKGGRSKRRVTRNKKSKRKSRR
jgi:hypothetical protein